MHKINGSNEHSGQMTEVDSICHFTVIRIPYNWTHLKHNLLLLYKVSKFILISYCKLPVLFMIFLCSV